MSAAEGQTADASATQRVLGLIPARGGSKGLPGKNTALLGGRPLIAWTVQAALAAKTVDDVVVTTDSEEIARVARDFGADVPFLRPAELAADDSPMIDVVLHALDALESAGTSYDSLALLQPTSPLRGAAHIDAAARLKQERGSEAVVSVTETDHSPLWSNTLPPDMNMGSFIRPDVSEVRRQDLPMYYRLNGAIYLVDTATVRARRTFVGDFAIAYVMSREASVDVDEAIDLGFAEFLISTGRVREFEATQGSG